MNGLLGRLVLVMKVAGSDTSEPRRTLNPLFVEALMGLAHRVDRLRLCGNGVVPLVAAHALQNLATELLPMDEGMA